MPSTRKAVAHKIAAPLHNIEQAIDLALAEAANLTLAMARGRGEARVAAQVGQDAFDALGETHAALTAARRHIVATHLALERVRADLNLPVTGHGDESEKLPDLTAATRRLQIAA
jgi:hypothetical protein